MGALGLSELLIIAVVVAMPLAVIAGVVLMLRRATSPRNPE